MNKSLKASAHTLKHLNSNKKSDQLFTELKGAQQLIQVNNNILSQLPTINYIDEYIFKPNRGIRKVLQDEKSLGTLSSKNKKHQGALDQAPWDVTIVSSDSLAVTLPDSKTIQFISFSPDSLSLKNKLKVNGKCDGISHHQGKLAVTFANPAKLQIMDLKGNTEVIVEKDSNGDNIFNIPWYVTTNRVSIYVSDYYKPAVLRFNWQGEMIGSVGINNPQGITLLEEESLLMNDYNSRCIHRVSGDCKDSKIILEDVDSPQAVCWCAESSTICVSRYMEDSGDNYIILYKMM
ncbi:uncharacterized protein LOC132742417 [Ruditapes philippinarum]|uniref:uncharacterized protein LOC132742417 n=1 Tax=Ruditapes philippinarum TaxID=129788 RepID=UPI00295B7670|nr:uncharacterized protein LOC132742417 [Ruditapes philippinarum]